MENESASDDAAAALDLVSASRAGLADRLVTPWWYHPALGLLAGVAVLGCGSGSVLLGALGVLVFGAGTGVLVGLYKRLTGVWASGYRPGPARRYAVGLGLALGAGLLASVVAQTLTDDWRPSALLAAAVAGLTVLLGNRYDQVLRADLRGETP